MKQATALFCVCTMRYHYQRPTEASTHIDSMLSLGVRAGIDRHRLRAGKAPPKGTRSSDVKLTIAPSGRTTIPECIRVGESAADIDGKPIARSESFIGKYKYWILFSVLLLCAVPAVPAVLLTQDQSTASPPPPFTAPPSPPPPSPPPSPPPPSPPPLSPGTRSASPLNVCLHLSLHLHLHLRFHSQVVRGGPSS